MNTKFKKGMVPWNKGRKGYMGANKTSFKKGDNLRPLPDRFWEKVNKTDTCWLWAGSKNNMGYGRINVDGIIKLAHRVLFELEGIKLERKQVVMHTCDTPLCVNPNHLRIGTQKDNIYDMIAKGRANGQFKKTL